MFLDSDVSCLEEWWRSESASEGSGVGGWGLDYVVHSPGLRKAFAVLD